MRGLASTLVLVVVLAGLGAYIYFVDSTRPASTGVEGEPARTKVFDVDNDKINEIKITAKGETTLLRKAEGGWQIVEPMAVDAGGFGWIGIDGHRHRNGDLRPRARPRGQRCADGPEAVWPG